MDTKDRGKLSNYESVKLASRRRVISSCRTKPTAADAQRVYGLSAMAKQTCVCHGAHNGDGAGGAVDNVISVRHQSSQFVLRADLISLHHRRWSLTDVDALIACLRSNPPPPHAPIAPVVRHVHHHPFF